MRALPQLPSVGGAWVVGVADMVEEVVAFPNAAHDDDVDAMTQALLRFKGSADGFFQYLQAEYQDSLKRRGVDPETIGQSEIAKQLAAEQPDPHVRRRQVVEDGE
jgi:hypothetical protein